MAQRIFYKKVSNINGKLLSAYIGKEVDPKLAIEYKIGSFVTGHPGTDLFVFKDYDSANQWHYGDDVYECEVEGEGTVLQIFDPISFLFLQWLRSKKNKKGFTSINPVPIQDGPKGTYLVKKVKLLRKVS